MSVRLTKLTTAMRVRSVRDASKDSSDTSSSYLQERGGCHRRSRNVWDEMDIRCADAGWSPEQPLVNETKSAANQHCGCGDTGHES